MECRRRARPAAAVPRTVSRRECCCPHRSSVCPGPSFGSRGTHVMGLGSNPAVALPPGRFLKRCDHRDRSHFISTVSPPPHSASHFRARVCALILSLFYRTDLMPCVEPRAHSGRVRSVLCACCALRVLMVDVSVVCAFRLRSVSDLCVTTDFARATAGVRV